MALEVRILGPLEAAVGGEPLRLAGRKQRSLLALLALSPGEPVSADLLIEELWRDFDDKARARLQVHVSHLRKALGASGAAIEWRSDGYVLDISWDAVDALRFEGLADTGGAALRAGDAQTAARTLREALALWRGDVLEDCEYGPLTQPVVARLAELRLVALEDRIDADLALGRGQDLVAELDALAREHPLRERIRGHQMTALYRAGRQSEALEAFADARRELVEGLGLEPGPDLRRLQEAILRQDPALAVEPESLRARRHLPAPATALVGRRAELDEVVRMLSTPAVRLLTLTGMGGSGKTRLAIQAAAELAERFDDGVWFVELAPLADAELVPQAVAHALAVAETSGEPLDETLASHLRDRRVLLVLDNFEHVDAAALLVSRLLEAAPELKVLATSRAPLRLYGEHEFAVPPLGLPDEAVALFAARAEAASQRFRLDEANMASVIELCARLDGLPLPIELAAARVRALSPEDMLASFPGRLELAAEGPRDVPARQQTLRATLDWSHGLLEPDARELFARLAVFVGGFTPEAAAEVCGATDTELAALAGESLLVRRRGAAGAARLDMLETVREYALQRLEEDGEAPAIRARHAQHFLVLAESAEPELSGPEGERLLATLEDEHANMRAALACARGSGSLEVELRLAGALASFWEMRSYLREGRAHLDEALASGAGQPAELRARVLAALAGLALRQGDYDCIRESAEQSLALFRSLGDQRGVAQSLNRLATAASNLGDYKSGNSLYEQSAEIFRELGDDHGLGSAITNLGCLALMEGDPERAAELSEDGIAHYTRAGERYAVLHPKLNLALARLAQGRLAEAFERLAGGLELARDLGYREEAIYYLEGIAATHAAAGEHARAAMLAGAASALAEVTAVTLEPLERDLHDGTVAACSAALGAAAFDAALAEGRALAHDEAVAFALAGLPDRQAAS